MPQTHYCFHHHVVFTTKRRFSMISDIIRPHLHAYLGGLLCQRDCSLSRSVAERTTTTRTLSSLCRFESPCPTC